MHGQAKRLIQKMGRTYTVRNATGGSGGLDTPAYSDDGTVVGVIERRSRPQAMTDSAGEDADGEAQIRVVPDGGVTIQPAGAADGYPTRLVHPGGATYEVVDEFVEDGGVHVLTVVTA